MHAHPPDTYLQWPPSLHVLLPATPYKSIKGSTSIRSASAHASSQIDTAQLPHTRVQEIYISTLALYWFLVSKTYILIAMAKRLAVALLLLLVAVLASCDGRELKGKGAVDEAKDLLPVLPPLVPNLPPLPPVVPGIPPAARGSTAGDNESP
ncbi:hypothetical protein ZWY2020_013151 [Hordeum vulgare]|nr:hypothetical protein ZWY2020_013151 [Hordeum vulgare]